MIYACLWICLLVFCGRRTVMGNLLLCIPPDNAFQSSNAHFERNETKNGKKSTERACSRGAATITTFHPNRSSSSPRQNFQIIKNMKINVFLNIVWFISQNSHAFCSVEVEINAQPCRLCIWYRFTAHAVSLSCSHVIKTFFYMRSRFRVRARYFILFFLFYYYYCRS